MDRKYIVVLSLLAVILILVLSGINVQKQAGGQGQNETVALSDKAHEGLSLNQTNNSIKSLESDRQGFKDRIISRIENDSVFSAVYHSDLKGTNEFLDGLINSTNNISPSEEQRYFQLITNRLRGEISFANVSFGKNEIIIFDMDGCPHCEEAIQFIDSMKAKYGGNISIEEINIDKRPENLDFANRCSEIFAKRKFDTTPFIIVNNKTIVSWGKEDEGRLESYIVD